MAALCSSGAARTARPARLRTSAGAARVLLLEELWSRTAASGRMACWSLRVASGRMAWWVTHAKVACGRTGRWRSMAAKGTTA